MPIPADIVTARQRSEKATSSLGQYLKKGATIEDELRKTVGEAIDYNKDLIEMRESTMGGYLKAPAQARARFLSPESEHFVLNPYEASTAIADYVASKYVPYATTSALLSARRGQEEDIIGAGTRAFGAQTTAAQAAAEAARRTYQDMLGEYELGEDIRLREAQIAATGANTRALRDLQELQFAAEQKEKEQELINNMLAGAEQRLGVIAKREGGITTEDIDKIVGTAITGLASQGVNVRPYTEYIQGVKSTFAEQYGAQQVPERGFGKIAPKAEQKIQQV